MYKETVKRRPTSPGTMLKEEFMVPYKITVDKLSSMMKVESTVLQDLLEEKEKVAVDLSIRLSQVFGTTVAFWMNLQNNVDCFDCWAWMAEEYNSIQEIVGD